MRRFSAPYEAESTIRKAAEIAGRIALRLTHDHELYLDYESYNNKLRDFIGKIIPYRKEMQVVQNTKRCWGSGGLFQVCSGVPGLAAALVVFTVVSCNVNASGTG